MKFYLSLLLLSTSLQAQDLDVYLRSQLNHFLITTPTKIERPNQELLVLGHELFRDKQLSGNNNISCHDCHHPMIGTGDNLSLAIGEGGLSRQGSRTQASGEVVKRHSPPLWNLGHIDQKEMFWDARVRIDRATNKLITPEPKLDNHPEITKNLTSALAAQVIFPLLSHEEMLGKPGSNPLANLNGSIEVWDAIIEKLKISKAPNGKMYTEMFNTVFPNEKHNIGHAAKAMESFIAWRFQVNDTPLDRYLAGDNQALSLKEKNGLNIFMNKGRCAVCHHGPLLTNNMLMNVGVPPLQVKGSGIDRGYRNRYAFKTPGLRNIAKSAPYMHNGVYSTIREVVDHYDQVIPHLRNFTIDPERLSAYSVELEIEKDPQILEDIEDNIIQPFLRNGLRLTSSEKDDLVEFLEKSLTSP